MRAGNRHPNLTEVEFMDAACLLVLLSRINWSTGILKVHLRIHCSKAADVVLSCNLSNWCSNSSLLMPIHHAHYCCALLGECVTTE